MSYVPDPADLVLSSVPGQEMFDPRKCKFAPEELKPQPMFKKARKVLFPDDMKVCVSSNLSDDLALCYPYYVAGRFGHNADSSIIYR